jgi:hypothetical protein
VQLFGHKDAEVAKRIDIAATSASITPAVTGEQQAAEAGISGEKVIG